MKWENDINRDDNQRVENNSSSSDYNRLYSNQETYEQEDYDDGDYEEDYEEDYERTVRYVYTEKDFQHDIRNDKIKKQTSAEYCEELSNRANYILLSIFILFVIVFIKILSLQLNSESSQMRDVAEAANYRHAKIPAKRGDILSVNREVMSSSVNMYKVFMDLRKSQLSDKKFQAGYKELADSLSAMFKDASPAAYCDSLLKWRSRNHGNKAVTPIGRLIDYNELERMKSFPILSEHPYNGGAKAQLFYVRKNYYGSLGRKIIGEMKTENINGSGIELSFNDYLKGVDGVEYQRKVSGSLWMPEDNSDNMEAQDGYDILSTIDIDIQDIATNSLYNMMDKNQVEWGTVVVMDVKTGEIRAMANLGRASKTGKLEENYNHAIGTSVEPGSTYKLIPLLALLEKKKVRLDTLINTKRGYDVINGIPVSDSHGYGVIPFKTCMSKSSNVGFARIMDDYYRRKPQDFVDFIKELGIANEINFQLPGEAKPIFRETTSPYWSKSDLVTMSYGYATQFTAMRILMLYNAIANNGKLISPIIVKEVLKDGEPIETFTAEVLNEKICSDATLEKVRIALEDVMYDGTVRSIFKNESYVVAGKTGTSRQVGKNGKYDQDDGRNYLASFVGYFPANNPEYTCIVQMKTFKPTKVARQYYGAALAAPVFKDISHYISTKSNWGLSARDYAAKKEREFIAEWTKVDAMQGKRMKSSDYYEDEKKRNYSTGKLNVSGDYEVVERLKESLDLSSYDLVNRQNNGTLELGSMPNVVGMGLDDALVALESLGLKVTVKGRGRVKSQSLKAGAAVKGGERVLINLEI